MDKESLHRYFAGKTSPEEERDIIRWTAASQENYRRFLEERKWWNAFLVRYDSIPAEKNTRQKKTINLWLVSTIAASIALLICLTRLYYVTDTPDDKWQSVWVPPGQRAQVILDDGTKIWLNSQSTLLYPTSFKGSKRIVKLNGEGYFEVEKNKDIPFIVETEKYDVEVLGTTFNIFAYNKNELFEASLLSGSIRIKPKEEKAPVITLKPNEMLADAGGELQIKEIGHLDHFRWREGLISLDDERFEDLIKKFALYFDIRITIENPELSDYRFTGKFRHSDGVEYALKVLQAEIIFSYTRNNESNEIVIK